MNSVKLSYFENSSGCDEVLATSYIIIDCYDALTNVAVLEAMRYKTPIFARTLPAHVDYLGERYPLYSDGVKTLNKLLLKSIVAQGQFFVCHHKSKTKHTMFVNSNDLSELDQLSDVVKCKVRRQLPNLAKRKLRHQLHHIAKRKVRHQLHHIAKRKVRRTVVYSTRNTLTRPWCTGEIFVEKELGVIVNQTLYGTRRLTQAALELLISADSDDDGTWFHKMRVKLNRISDGGIY